MADIVRYYLPSTGAAAVSPAYAATWETVNSVVRLAAVTTKISSAMASQDTAEPETGVAKDNLCVQYVTAALAAREWTTSDSLKIQILSARGSAVTTAYLRLVVRVVSNDGGTFRGTLYDGVDDNNFPTSPYTNRNMGGSVNVQNAVSQQLNDRLVIEIGGLQNNSGAWDGIVLRVGDNNASDLPENETGTDAYNPWVEFTMETGGGVIGPSGAIVSAEDVDGAAMMRGTIQSEV